MGQLLELLDKQRQKWAKDVLSLTDADKKEIALKRGFDNAMIDFFSFRYHKRSKLIDQSSVELGYCFKEVLSSSHDPVALTYVLFSPSPSVYEDENFLPQIAAKLFDLGREEIKKHRRDQLFWKMRDSLAEAYYFQLDERFAGDKLVYLSIFERRLSEFPYFHLGYNLFLANKGVSKEILLLPKRYFTAAWEEYYSPKKEEKDG